MSTLETVIINIAVGTVVITISAIIYIVRLLHKKRRKRKDLENSGEITTLEMVEIPPKKTAANHLEEIKEATQKILRPLKKTATPKDSRSSLKKERNSTKSSKFFNKKVQKRSRSSQLSRNGSRYGSRNDSRVGSKVGSLKNSSFLKSQKKMPSPPPLSHLKSQDDYIEIDPSLLNILPSDASPSSSKVPAQVPSRAQSRGRSYMRSKTVSSGTTSPRDPLNPKQEPKYSIQPIAKKETNDYTKFQPVQNNKGKTVVR